MTKDVVLNKYERVFDLYSGTKKANKFPAVEACIDRRDYAGAHKILSEFKTEEELIRDLEEKLRGKPINDSLRKIRRNLPIENRYVALKTLSSFTTHCLIECEKGNEEYRYIARKACHKLIDLLK